MRGMGRIRHHGRKSAAVASCVAMLVATPAAAHIGPSYLHIPGVTGNARVAPYKNWIRVEADYWKPDEGGMFGSKKGPYSGRNSFRRSRMVYSGPAAPTHGPDQLVVSLDKHNPALGALMA